MNRERVVIFDTTLRDGEQCPGASLTPQEKLEVARQLARLNVDVIEAGFAYASPGDFEGIQMIAKEVKGPVLCSLARSRETDIDAAARALKAARRFRIHTFIATSPVHMRYKLRMGEDEVLEQAVRAVKMARRHTDDVEFSPEDASRTETPFLYRVLSAVIAAGAKTINIPDTVGYAVPDRFGQLIAGIRENVRGVEKAVISVHCHNDLGLSVANSLAAVQAGARQVECTINGLGERAGNAALEEVVMGLRTRRDVYRVTTDVRTEELVKASRLVSKLTGMVVQMNKAIVGENAFRHESGIHQDGMLKKKLTYEIISPKTVGFGESRLVLGKHSGRHAFVDRLKRLGWVLSEAQVEQAFDRFKRLADQKKEVFDEDLTAIVEDQVGQVPQRWQLEYLHVTSGTQTVPTATVRLRIEDRVLQDAASGDGPVDACYRTIDRITGVQGVLLDYALRSVTGGKDAQGEVTVKIRAAGRVVGGRGTSTDVIEASAKAYLSAINKVAYLGKAKGRKASGAREAVKQGPGP